MASILINVPDISPSDLLNAKIYETVRKAVAYQCRYLLEAHLNGLAALPVRTAPFYALAQPTQAWA